MDVADLVFDIPALAAIGHLPLLANETVPLLANDAVPVVANDTVPLLATLKPSAFERVAIGPGWRIEVTGKGGYWQWRSGSGSSRKSIYGGKFENLSPERKAQYERNKTTKARRTSKRG